MPDSENRKQVWLTDDQWDIVISCVSSHYNSFCNEDWDAEEAIATTIAQQLKEQK